MLQPLLDRVRRLPASVQPLVLEGVRRTLDYQDRAYAGLYLERVEDIAQLDTQQGAPAAGALTQAVARSLALWMTFEDTIRVADLKTRSDRFARVRSEIRAGAGQLFGITEFLRPGVAEIAGTLPAALGSWVLRSPRVIRRLDRYTSCRQVRTTTVSGFLLLHTLAGGRPEAVSSKGAVGMMQLMPPTAHERGGVVPLGGGFAGRVASPDSGRPASQAAQLCQRGLTLRR